MEIQDIGIRYIWYATQITLLISSYKKLKNIPHKL